MRKTEEEIEKMLLDELEETIVMGWADGSEKSLLLELIRERQAKIIGDQDVKKSVCVDCGDEIGTQIRCISCKIGIHG